VKSPIRTRRLLLRCWRREDAPLLRRAIDASLPELRQWMDWAAAEPSPFPDLEERLEGFRTAFAAGRDWPFGIFDRAESEVFGGCGLHRRLGPRALEIGYWIRSDATRRGFGTEVAAALTGAALAADAIERVEIRCDPNNRASAAIPRRLGFRHVATRRRDALTPRGEPRDTMIWEMRRSDWRPPVGPRVRARSRRYPESR